MVSHLRPTIVPSQSNHCAANNIAELFYRSIKHCLTDLLQARNSISTFICWPHLLRPLRVNALFQDPAPGPVSSVQLCSKSHDNYNQRMTPALPHPVQLDWGSQILVALRLAFLYTAGKFCSTG